MITPGEEEIAENNENSDSNRSAGNDQDNAQSLETDLANVYNDDSIAVGEVEADTDNIDVAARAAEAAYTLDVDKGISPEPIEKNDEYNIKK